MEKLFYLLWAAVSLGLGGLALSAVWQQASVANLLFLGMVGYYSFCFGGLIRAFYLPWGLLGPHRRSGYWLCLILLPLALVPLHAAYRVWEQGGYVAVAASRRTAWLQQLLGWLQDALGYLGPLLALCALGIGLALALLHLLRGQVVR